MSIGAERQREAKTDKDDADVLDGGIGQQTLQVVLHQRGENADHRGDGRQGQHDQARPPRRLADQIEHDPDEAVDGDLGHHPAHQRRDMARRRRMRQRQPDVERHEARFRARTDQRKQQHQGACDRIRMVPAHRRERIAAVGPCQQTERQQQRQRAEARHDEIDEARAGVLRRAVVRHHQRPGRQRHEFPGDQE